MQLVGSKNAGKTTLLCRLTEELAGRGLSVATIKHDGHELEDERPGCDTRRHRESGAVWSAVSSASRAILVEERGLSLPELIRLAPPVDVLLVEGFKREPLPKLLVARSLADLELLPQLAAVAGIALRAELHARSGSLGLPDGIPVLGVDEAEALADLSLAAGARAGFGCGAPGSRGHRAGRSEG
ncbi:molybdopterin-guanine dinucleotide biosynthesis protein B [Paenibacillus albicereus]|uniref:Molybdopterin-guanine dinucleotide biosynthesis protein B n=2 Tax=Paenibacillus albicereus TaxID=2726185 RepID=A0A6H2H479_9BACL|nr:molybdopterin-guanine dinucleotide biosynthesis protein B [Paenibacillus albicereus]